ncbi:MAG: cation:proton antiporter [Gaiella sp.]
MVGAGPGLDWADPYAIGLVVLGVSLLAAVGALSHEHDRAFSASVIYLVLGLGAAALIELAQIDWISPIDDAELVERLSELAVIFALFSTGLQIDRRLGVRRWLSAGRLLVVTMPLTIAAVVLFATLVMGLPLAIAILLGAALAPTDPVLAGDLGVGPPGEHDEREPNFAITAEAGLNDGLAFPFVLLAVVLASERGGTSLIEWFAADVVYAVVVGLGMGVGAGWLLAALIVPLRSRRLLRPEFDAWLALGCVLLLYGLTEVVSAYGFLAAFAGGLAFRRYERESDVQGGVYVGADAASKFGELAVLLLLGSVVTLDGLAEPGVSGWLLCLTLLFVIRPLAVLVAFVRSRLCLGERLFLAWFGVRGIGSLYYAAAALSLDVLARGQEGVVFWTVAVAVLLSVLLHGITGTPLSRRLLERR